MLCLLLFLISFMTGLIPPETIVAIPVINGGIVATQMMTQAAMDHGLALAAALGTITFAVQKFVGTPIASFFRFKRSTPTFRGIPAHRYKS